MADTAKQTAIHPLGSLMKTVGRLTSPETPTGKAFKRWEDGMTKVFLRLAGSDLYLNSAGRTMSRMFKMQALYNRALERYLHALRMPTSGDVNDLRQQVRQMHDQVEALSTQLEFMIESLETLKSANIDATRKGKKSSGTTAEA